MSTSISIPTNQKAILTAGADKPITVTDYPVPTIKNNQVLIHVYASSINAADPKVHQYNPFKVPLPFPLGYDVSGVIVQVGSEVKNFKVGDEVVGSPSIIEPGAFVQYYAADATRVTHKPKTVSYEDAATLNVAFLSAYDGLVNQVKRGDIVYVPGGAGGVNHFAVQLAKYYGAKVISSASKKEGLQYLQSIGVDYVFNYKQQNPVEEVLQFTAGAGVDVVYDSTAGNYDQSIEVLKQGGKLIVLSVIGLDVESLKKKLAVKNAQFVLADLLRYCIDRSHDLDFILPGLKVGLQLISEGKLKPHIESVLQFDEVPAALEKMANGYSPVGKIVVINKQ